MSNELSKQIAKWSLRKQKDNSEKTRIYLFRYIPVYPNDNWCPNFKGNKVRVSLRILFENNIIYSHVSIWGNDDTGVIREYDDISDAIDMYIKIASNTCPSWKKLVDPIGKWKFNRA